MTTEAVPTGGNEVSLNADAVQFTQVYSDYRNTVFGIALNYTKNDADANDILQEVFLKVYRSTKRFESTEHLKAWLIRVTINACKKHLLSFRTKETVPLNDTIPLCEPEDSEVLAAVMTLPKTYRLAVHLYYYEGYSIEEIASILRINQGAIKMRLSRARKLLKEKLKEEWADE